MVLEQQFVSVSHSLQSGSDRQVLVTMVTTMSFQDMLNFQLHRVFQIFWSVLVRMNPG